MSEPHQDDRYEVVVVRYGTRSTTASEVYLNHHLYGDADRPMEMDYFFWVVRNAHRTICVDTGFSRAGGEARGRTVLIEPAAAYAAVGVDLAQAPPVVVTHAHYDHIGNLDLFPHSPVVIARQEVDFWTGPHRGRRQFHHSVEEAELDLLARAVDEGRVTQFEETHDLAPGVQLVRVGGHTPGQSMVRVRTSAGLVLLASDAVHYYEELERDMPFSSVADLVGMYDGFDLVRRWTEDGEVAHLVPGHDPDTLRRLPALPGLEGTAAVIGALAPAGAPS